MPTSILSVATVVALAGAAYVFFLWMRRRLEAGRPVAIGEMMSRHGLDMKAVSDHGLEDDLVNHARACVKCAHHDLCAERLRGAGTPDYCDICPNAGFLDGLKKQAHAA